MMAARSTRDRARMDKDACLLIVARVLVHAVCMGGQRGVGRCKWWSRIQALHPTATRIIIVGRPTSHAPLIGWRGTTWMETTTTAPRPLKNVPGVWGVDLGPRLLLASLPPKEEELRVCVAREESPGERVRLASPPAPKRAQPTPLLTHSTQPRTGRPPGCSWVPCPALGSEPRRGRRRE